MMQNGRHSANVWTVATHRKIDNFKSEANECDMDTLKSTNFTVADARNVHKLPLSITHLSVFLVIVEFSLVVHEVMVVVMMVMVHHGIRIEHQLYVDSVGKEGDFSVSLTASVLEANSTLLLGSVAESSVTDLKFIFSSHYQFTSRARLSFREEN
jgi:hypothetical protein